MGNTPPSDSGQPEAARKLRTLTGKWSMRDWRHDKEEEDKERTVTSEAELVQERERVHGLFTNSDGSYELEGTIRNGTIWTGTWTLREEGVGGIWHGAFQFRILDRTDRMLGRWVGVTKNLDHIDCGVWEWKRHGVDKYPTEISPDGGRLGTGLRPLLKWLSGLATVVVAAWLVFYLGPNNWSISPRISFDIGAAKVEAGDISVWPITFRNHSRPSDEPSFMECRAAAGASISDTAFGPPNNLLEHESFPGSRPGARPGIKFRINPIPPGGEMVINLRIKGQSKPKCGLREPF